MKRMTALAMVAAFGLVSAAYAADREAPKGDRPNPDKPAVTSPLTGKIVKVDNGVVTVLPAADGAKEVALDKAPNTVVTVDGKEAKVADLKAGMNVVVTWGGGAPPKIAATTK